ncbi:hypothetical protein [Mariniphaga sediminis]|uniref:hypothetical protein n=1 Tax=Mariniphaga sediminis TaxID=1628158 RepID=UPI003566BC7C
MENIGEKNKDRGRDEAEKGLISLVMEVETLTEQNLSRAEIRDSYNQSLVQLFNNTIFLNR